MLRHTIPFDRLHAVSVFGHGVQSSSDPRQILFGTRKNWSKTKRLTLAEGSEPRRLALEMLVHEESERRWLAGELKALEAECVRAEEIAAIADGLMRDPAIEGRLGELGATGRAW